MSFIYYLIGVTGLLSAQVVASSLNPIHRIAFLIQVFLSGSFLMILLDFYFLGLTYIIVYVGAIMILFLFVIMMVQIHLMPLTLAVSPRVLLTGTSASQQTPANLPIGRSGLTSNSQLALLVDNGISDHDMTCHGTDLAITLVMDSGKTNAKTNLQIGKSAMALANDEVIRSLTLSNSFISTIRSLVLALLFIQSLVTLMKSSQMNPDMVVNYFFPSWSIEFKTMTDLETLAHILYVGYPTALILVSVALWVVMIGIIKVTMSEKA